MRCDFPSTIAIAMRSAIAIVLCPTPDIHRSKQAGIKLCNLLYAESTGSQQFTLAARNELYIPTIDRVTLKSWLDRLTGKNLRQTLTRTFQPHAKQRIDSLHVRTQLLYPTAYNERFARQVTCYIRRQIKCDPRLLGCVKPAMEEKRDTGCTDTPDDGFGLNYCC